MKEDGSYKDILCVYKNFRVIGLCSISVNVVRYGGLYDYCNAIDCGQSDYLCDEKHIRLSGIGVVMHDGVSYVGR